MIKRNADEARSYFARVGTDLVTHLAQLSSVATELTLTERLHIFRDFFKAGEQAAAEFNIHKHAKRGQHFKDWLCPDSMEFTADHFKLDARYGRVLYLQPEPEAQGLALSSELFITGTLNTFARHTNVDTQARIIAYDIRELGEQLMPLGMLVTLDAIYNRVIQNWKKGRRTWIFCDEFYILFRYEYSANFFYKLWKRIRKYNGLVTGLTQNVDELLRSDTARLMLANSEFLVMLNQGATDREELAKLLNISDNQLGYVTNVPAGCGLIRCAGNIVPFTNSFPKNTKLYKLMSTNPSEKRE